MHIPQMVDGNGVVELDDEDEVIDLPDVPTTTINIAAATATTAAAAAAATAATADVPPNLPMATAASASRGGGRYNPELTGLPPAPTLADGGGSGRYILDEGVSGKRPKSVGSGGRYKPELPGEDNTPGQEVKWPCPDCGREFQSANGLGGHRKYCKRREKSVQSLVTQGPTSVASSLRGDSVAACAASLPSPPTTSKAATAGPNGHAANSRRYTVSGAAAAQDPRLNQDPRMLAAAAAAAAGGVLPAAEPLATALEPQLVPEEAPLAPDRLRWPEEAPVVMEQAPTAEKNNNGHEAAAEKNNGDEVIVVEAEVDYSEYETQINELVRLGRLVYNNQIDIQTGSLATMPYAKPLWDMGKEDKNERRKRTLLGHLWNGMLHAPHTKDNQARIKEARYAFGRDFNFDDFMENARRGKYNQPGSKLQQASRPHQTLKSGAQMTAAQQKALQNAARVRRDAPMSEAEAAMLNRACQLWPAPAANGSPVSPPPAAAAAGPLHALAGGASSSSSGNGAPIGIPLLPAGAGEAVEAARRLREHATYGPPGSLTSFGAARLAKEKVMEEREREEQAARLREIAGEHPTFVARVLPVMPSLQIGSYGVPALPVVAEPLKRG